MAANTAPIFTLTPRVSWAESMVTANNTVDLSSGTIYSVFTAGANGSFLDHARVKMNPAANGVATVIRFWVNNGSTVATPANSAIIGELSIPATTAIATAALPDFVYPLGFAIPAAYVIYATLGTAPGGSAEMTCAIIGGDY